jgi:hypothetical protein
MRWIFVTSAAFLLCAASFPAAAEVSPERKIELIRDFTAEMGTVQMMLPRSKKSLDILPDGTYDTSEWAAAMQEYGVAARLGDMIQITGVQVTDKRLVLTINYGLKGGRKWWHRIQVSGGGGQRNDNLGRLSETNAPGGTEIALFYEDGLPDKTTEEFKALLKNVLDFEIRSATEQYMETIEPKFKKAIEENEVIAGMDKEMVLLAKNRPDSKYRETKDGVDTEDWIYGKPPGDVVFVTFHDGKVVSIKYTYASLGGEIQKSKPIER